MRPVVKRLALVYGIDAVLGVLVDDRDPGTVLPIQPDEEVELAAYDRWTIENASGAEWDSGDR